MLRLSSVFALAVSLPLFAFGTHAQASSSGVPPATPARLALPKNLCSSCHGARSAMLADHAALGLPDLLATRSYLRASPRG